MSYLEFVKRTLTVFGIGILCILGWQLRSILMIAFLSSIIAVSLSIPVNRLQRVELPGGRRISRGVAIATTLVSVVVGIVLFFTWIMPVLAVQMADVVRDLPEAAELAVQAYEDWRVEQNETLRDALPEANIPEIRDTLGLKEGDSAEDALFGVQDVAGFVLPVLAGAGNVLVAALANVVIVILVSIFLLLDPLDYARGVVTLTPPRYRARMLEIMVELRTTVTTWMTALSLSILVTVFLVWLVLGMGLGVPNALALGVIAGMMTIIPNIGSLIPLFPIIIFTLADDPGKLPWVLIAYFAIQQTESNIITPFFVKRQLSIPTGLLFLFQLVSAALFGFFGILLAVPLLATIMTLVRELYVHDILQMEGVTVDIEHRADGSLRLVTADAPPPHRTRVFSADEEIFASPD